MKHLPAKTVAAYSNAVGRYGPDSEQAKAVRAAHADDPDFLEYADALDRIKRTLGGSGIDYQPDDGKGNAPMIEVLIGMIASSKSTYALKRADEGALVVCHDGLVEMLHARYRYEQDLRFAYRAMEEAIVWQAIRAGRDVVVDRTHLTRESRNRWVEFAASIVGGRSRVVAVAFPVEAPEVHARRRFDHDPRGRPYEDWLAVARHHHAQATAEGFDWKAEGFDDYHLETHRS